MACLMSLGGSETININIYNQARLLNMSQTLEWLLGENGSWKSNNFEYKYSQKLSNGKAHFTAAESFPA